MDARDMFYFSLGAVIGIAGYAVHQSNQQPKSFEECFLAESKGRQVATLWAVKKLCQQQFGPPQR